MTEAEKEKNMLIAEKSHFIGVNEIKQELDVKQTTAYKIIRALNEELERDGFLTHCGRVPRDYFYKRYGLTERR